MLHTVYVGAHAFDARTPGRLVEEARSFFRGALAEPSRLAEICDLPKERARRVVHRVGEGPADRPVDDLRVDFEDGYRGRDEVRDAVRVAAAAAEAHGRGELPAGFGVRVHSMAEATAERSRGTLERVLGGLRERLVRLPPGFVVTLAKIDDAEEVTRLADALDELEAAHDLEEGAVAVELMAETPRSIYDAEGRLAVPHLVAAARGRCVGVHFGVYDYTASLGLSAGNQRLRHPACDAARAALQIGLGGLAGLAGEAKVHLSDGSSRVVPRLEMGEAELARAVREVYDDVRHSLARGIVRGWDLAGSHVAIRRVAVTAFYLEELPELTRRWHEAVADSSEDLEDAATLAVLRATFRRGLRAGALVEDDLPDETRRMRD